MVDTNLQLDVSCHQVKPSVPNGTSSSNPSPQSSENYVEEEAERLEKPEGMDGLHQRNSVFQTDTLQRLWLHVQGLHRFVPVEVPVLRGGIGYFLPSLINKLSSTDTYLQSKN